MISEILQKARQYEEKYGAFISDSERPVYHLSPKVGWMNDPNGFSMYDGKYHIFYQYHPYSTQWGPMHWGHAVTSDLLHWQFLPAAIAPDMPYDKDGCFSGSAIEMDDGKQLLMYTGVERVQGEDGRMQDIQIQCLATGDGENYEKYEGNPVLTQKDIPAGFSLNDFRDPKIFRNTDGSYGCVLGNRTEDGSGAILLYRSEDGFNWKFSSILDRSYNEFGRMWECPDMFTLDGQDVIITSPQDMSALGLEFHSGNGTMALMGRVEEGKFLRDNVQAIDYGLDFYAPQTLETPDGRRIMIAWMQNWDTTGGCPEGAKWFGQMTTPRELTICNDRLIQNPIRELEALRGRRVAYKNVPVHEEVSLTGVYGRVVDMTVTIKPGDNKGYERFRVKFAKGSQHYCSVSYRPGTSTLRLSRTHAGFNRDFVHERKCMVRNQSGEIKLRILLDRYSAEVFVNDGEQALTMTFYTPQTAEGISFECTGNALVSVEKYDIIAAE
jgi:beta-fructofuranosidase